MAFKTTQQQKQQQDSDKPVHTVRAGALSVSIWAREHEGKTFYSATPQRAYTKDDGANWEYSASFGRDDLATVATLLNMALAWIVTQGAKAQ
jgi:hypothetical protein